MGTFSGPRSGRKRDLDFGHQAPTGPSLTRLVVGDVVLANQDKCIRQRHRPMTGVTLGRVLVDVVEPARNVGIVQHYVARARQAGDLSLAYGVAPIRQLEVVHHAVEGSSDLIHNHALDRVIESLVLYRLSTRSMARGQITSGAIVSPATDVDGVAQHLRPQVA